MTTPEDVERAIMLIEALGAYTRRGATCRFTWRLTGHAPMIDADGDPYWHSYHWAYCRWTGAEWEYVDGHSHRTYPPPREPTRDELLSALTNSETARRAIAAMEAK